jgi:hypothetical protein
MRFACLVIPIATVALACFNPVSIAEADKSQLMDLEQRVGKGWQCFAIPTGLDRVGVVLEQRKDKSVFYVDDLKETGTLTTPVAIGQMSSSKHLSLGAAIKLISAFFPSLNVSLDFDKKTTIVISGAEEVVGGQKSSQDAIEWAQKNLGQFHPGSKLFVIREAILASGVTYTFDTSTATAIAAQLSLNEPKTATASGAPNGNPASGAGTSKTKSPDTTSDKTAGSDNTPGKTGQDSAPAKQSSTVSKPNNPNQITQAFDPKIGICIHPDQLILGNSLGGDLKATIEPVTQDLGFK